MSISTAVPTIIVLSIGDTSEPATLEFLLGRLVNKISQKSSIKYARNAQEALELLNGHTNIKGLFVTDSGIAMKRNKAVSDTVVRLVQNGGTVVLGGSFSSSIRQDSLNTYFDTKWNLSWKGGSYLRTTVFLNQMAEKISANSLVTSYSQKALFLANVESKAAWYLPSESSVTESRVFAPEPVNVSETPIAFTKIGNGWLGYVGDVNAEEGTDNVVLAMLGLI